MDNTVHIFSCHNCGSAVCYKVGSKFLECENCGQKQDIIERDLPIKETPLNNKQINDSLLSLKTSNLQANEITTCGQCGASLNWQIDTQSDVCPYCKTPIAKLDTNNQRLHIEAIIPFTITSDNIPKIFSDWVKSRWFSPNSLKEMSGYAKLFKGVYIPYWTFDTLTTTQYTGLRGEYYVTYETVQETINGQTQMLQKPVTKIRWFPASGNVTLFFDDILVLANMLIPKILIQALQPWKLTEAKPYNEQYLSGMTSKYYQIDLSDAFINAKEIISNDIERAICNDIGGDTQQITSKNSQYQNSTYKLVLLPIWQSSYQYQGKNYQVIINGQSGKITGNYPKSIAKIIFFVATILALVIPAAYYYSQHYQQF